MGLPFTTEDFLAVFIVYNRTIWPIQIVAYFLGALAIGMAMFESRESDITTGGVLGLFWLWMGLVYHGMFFSRITAAGWAFAGIFVAQGLFFMWEGVLKKRLRFRLTGSVWSALGAGLIAYAMVAYPLLSISGGHPYPQMPAFGVAPGPTTIFTFGLLLWSQPPLPKYLLAIPLIWSFVGMTAVTLGVLPDLALPVAALAGALGVTWRDRTVPVQIEEQDSD